ncbi:hypothetical protein KAR91_33125 [Candidatus Pacearchaeota archaeon]|nr:hypothetical protein [Candidatus Pacearchaeota archaeon]
MNEEIKIATLKAINKLINHYGKYAPTGIPDSYGSIQGDVICPLCEIFTCSQCPWMLFEGKNCMEFVVIGKYGPRLYETGTTEERIERLNRWKGLLNDSHSD